MRVKTEDKWIQFVARLIRLTQERKLVWKQLEPPHAVAAGSADVIPVFFVTEVKGKILALYERRFRYYFDEDDWAWSAKPVLSLLASDGSEVFEFPEKPVTRQLYEEVSRRVADVDSLIDEVLQEPSEPD